MIRDQWSGIIPWSLGMNKETWERSSSWDPRGGGSWAKAACLWSSRWAYVCIATVSSYQLGALYRKQGLAASVDSEHSGWSTSWLHSISSKCCCFRATHTAPSLPALAAFQSPDSPLPEMESGWYTSALWGCLSTDGDNLTSLRKPTLESLGELT